MAPTLTEIGSPTDNTLVGVGVLPGVSEVQSEVEAVVTEEEPPFDGNVENIVSLVEKARSGDKNALGNLFSLYSGMVYGIVIRVLGNCQDSEEVRQEVFVQAMRKINTLRDCTKFRSWLCTIARNMAINRAIRRKPFSSDGMEDISVEHETPFVSSNRNEQLARVHLALDKLNKLDRDTLIAFYFEKKSLIEMSDQFDAPIGTIKRRLHVARKRFAKEIGELGTDAQADMTEVLLT